MEMLLTGEMVSASRAAEMGLVNQVVPSADLCAGSMALAGKIASKSSLTVATGKRAFYQQKEMDLKAPTTMLQKLWSIICWRVMPKRYRGLYRKTGA